MKINRLALVGLCTVSLLQAGNTISVYGGGIDYTDSIKDTGFFAGAYFQNSSLKNKIELGYERTEISYIDDTLENIEQNDFSIAWDHYVGQNFLFRLGGHYIDSNGVDTDRVYTAFAGAKYYQGYDFDIGLDGYYSDYSDYRRADGTTGLNVMQVEPSIGFGFGNYQSCMGSAYLRTYYTYIQSDRVEGGSVKDSYHSGGLVLQHFKGNWTNGIGGWIGKQVFAVKNKGFTVFNLAEERKGGFALSSSYAFSKSTSLRLQYAYESFEEIVASNDITDASTTTMSLFLNYNF